MSELTGKFSPPKREKQMGGPAGIVIVATLAMALIVFSIIYRDSLHIPLIVVLLFSLMFIGMALVNLRSLLLGFIFMLPFQFKGYSFAFGHLSITDVGIMIIFAAWALKKMVKGDIRLPKEGLLVFLFIFAILMSICFNLNGFTYYTYLFRLLSTIMLFFVYFDTLEDKETFLNFLKFLVLTGFIVSVYNFFEFFLLKADIPVFKGGEFFNVKRVVSIFNQSNLTATFLSIILPFSFFYYSFTRRKFYLAASLFITGGIILTFSKAGFLVLMVIFFFLPIKKVYKLTSLVLIITVVFFSGNFTSRLSSVKNRLFRYTIVLDMMARSPVFGSGFRTYKKVYVEYDDVYTRYCREFIPSSHSLFLQLSVETGILGLCVFTIFMLAIYRKLKKSVRLRQETYFKFFPAAFFALIVGQLASANLTCLLIWGTFALFLRVDRLQEEDVSSMKNDR